MQAREGTCRGEGQGSLLWKVGRSRAEKADGQPPGRATMGIQQAAQGARTWRAVKRENTGRLLLLGGMVRLSLRHGATPPQNRHRRGLAQSGSQRLHPPLYTFPASRSCLNTFLLPSWSECPRDHVSGFGVLSVFKSPGVTA